jgi:predicted TIM-barrel fold metal-dependent hydrolase
VNRRTFLGTAVSALGAGFPIVDTHIHLFDPRRPQGVPWPDRSDNALYRPALPGRYRMLAEPFGITAAIEVECSPWLEDNQWVLNIAARDRIMVGMVGNLEPGKPDFRKTLERFRRNPLFLGIRYGNLWGRNLGAQLGNPEFIAGLKLLAEAGLVLDTANPTPQLIADVLRLTDRVPVLRVVLDHLAQIEPPPRLRELAQRPQVYVKGSAVLRRVNGRVPTDMGFYRARLDTLYELFGPDRLVYGSDWPNSDHVGTYAQVFRVVSEYFEAKPLEVRRKFFYENSQAAYRWRERS